MKVTLEPTDLMVPFDGLTTRCWRGVTDSGVRVVACIALITVRAEADSQAFDCALAEIPPGEVPLAAMAMRRLGSLL